MATHHKGYPSEMIASFVLFDMATGLDASGPNLIQCQPTGTVSVWWGAVPLADALM
jgi:hypothetical protein